jgi:hypothetical protein
MDERLVQVAQPGLALSPTGTGAARFRRILAATGKVLRKPQFWFGLVGIVPTVIYYCIFSFGPILRAFPIAMQTYISTFALT